MMPLWFWEEPLFMESIPLYLFISMAGIAIIGWAWNCE